MSEYAPIELPPGGDHNKGPALEAANLVSFCFAAIVVTARVLYRILKIKHTSWDDYTIVLATIAAAVNTTFIVKYVENGGGRHAVYLGAKAVEVKKWSTIAQIPFIISATLTKLSIALMIMRISNSRKLKWAMVPLVTVVVCINFAGLIILTAGCKPFEGQWNYVIGRKCWPRQVMMNQNWVQGIVSIGSDFLYTSMPIFVVWGLNITKRQKVAITGLIALGLVATACSIARMVLYETFTSWSDTTYGFSDLQIWTALEQNLGIIAASLPTLRVFFKELGRAIASSSRSLLGAFSAQSRSTMSDIEGPTDKVSDLEKGMPHWTDSGSSSTSASSGKVPSAQTDLFDEKEIDLKYLGGSLEL